MSFVFVAIALVIGVGCMGLSFAHVRRVEATASPGELRAVAAILRKLPAGDRLGELARRGRAGSFEHRLAIDLMEAKDEGTRVAAVNDALAEIEQALTEGERWPGSATRIAAWGTMLIGVVAFLAQTGTPILVIAGIGGVSVVGCLGAMRRASQSVRDRREAVDTLITALLGRPTVDAESRGGNRRRTNDQRKRRPRSPLPPSFSG